MDGVLPLGSDPTALNAALMQPKFGAIGNVDAAAQDFEAMFATQLLQPMFETVPVDGVFGGGNGEEVMRTFLLQEYGKIIAKTGVLGIATQVKTEMLRAQEGARRGATASPSKAKDAYQNASATAAKGAAYVASR